MDRWDELKNVYGEAPPSFEARIRMTLDNLPEEQPVAYRRGRKHWATMVAAAVMVVLLAGTAFATDFFGLGSLRVADPFTATTAPTEEPLAEAAAPAQDSIALQGLPESPEFLATAEWMDFLAGYDPDRTKLKALGNTATGLEETYGLYFVYTQEMADALDEIVARHGLKLHSSIQFFDTADKLYKLSGIPAFLGSTPMNGYLYEDGSFLFSASSVFAKGTVFAYEFNRHVKGSFSEVTLNIGNADSYEQWDYETPCGTSVHMFMGAEKCLILADLDTAFVSVNVLGGTTGGSQYMKEPVTREALEAFANLIDFSKLG